MPSRRNQDVPSQERTITLTRAAMVQLLDALNPNPEDPGGSRGPWGPYGPGGPVVHSHLERLLWALLNPQPLPPGPDPYRALSWALLNPQPLPPRSGPVPDPWRSTLVARAVVDRALSQLQFADVLANTRASEKGVDAVREQIRQFVDDFCGTGPHPWPRPWPGPPWWDVVQLHPLDLLVAGAQFEKAATALPNHPLQEEFAAAADRLFEAGLQQLSSGQMQR